MSERIRPSSLKATKDSAITSEPKSKTALEGLTRVPFGSHTQEPGTIRELTDEEYAAEPNRIFVGGFQMPKPTTGKQRTQK